MSVAVLYPGASAPVVGPSGEPLPLGSILVVADTGVSDLADLLDLWQSNPWCPAVVVAADPGTQRDLRRLLPVATRIEGVPAPTTVASICAAVRSTPPSDYDCNAYLRHRLGEPASDAIVRARDPRYAGTGARRVLHRLGLPGPGYWRILFATVQCLGSAIAGGYTEALAAERAGISVKTMSRRCETLFGTSWRRLVGMSAWEASMELALRDRGVVAGSSSARAPLHVDRR